MGVCVPVHEVVVVGVDGARVDLEVAVAVGVEGATLAAVIHTNLHTYTHIQDIKLRVVRQLSHD
jgi:hypothetical protein